MEVDPWPRGWGSPWRPDPVGMRPAQGLHRLSTCPVNGIGQRLCVKTKAKQDGLLYPPMGFGRRGKESLRKEHVIIRRER